MPLYEYVCRKCHNKFGEVLTIKDHETKKVTIMPNSFTVYSYVKN